MLHELLVIACCVETVVDMDITYVFVADHTTGSPVVVMAKLEFVVYNFEQIRAPGTIFSTKHALEDHRQAVREVSADLSTSSRFPWRGN